MATAKKAPAPRKTASVSKKVSAKRAAAPAKAAKAPSVKKAAAKPAPVKKQAAKPAPKAEKPAKVKKPKLVRDSFTIPKAEYLVLEELKQRGNKLARPVKKSELLRAGIKALAALPDAAFLTALSNVPTIKTGRPTLSV
jgi:hypothetical protein